MTNPKYKQVVETDETIQVNHHDEVWKPIPGYEGRYEVSNMGRVASLNYCHRKRRQVLKPTPNNYGYLHLKLTKDKHHRDFTVHKLVMLSFVGARPKHLVIDHINRDKSDNRLENLRYVSPSENARNTERYLFKQQRTARATNSHGSNNKYVHNNTTNNTLLIKGVI